MSTLFLLNLKTGIYLFERSPSRKLCWLCPYMLCAASVCLKVESSHKLPHVYSGKGDFLLYVVGSQNIKVTLERKVLLHLQHVFKVMIRVLAFLFSS